MIAPFCQYIESESDAGAGNAGARHFSQTYKYRVRLNALREAGGDSNHLEEDADRAFISPEQPYLRHRVSCLTGVMK